MNEIGNNALKMTGMALSVSKMVWMAHDTCADVFTGSLRFGDSWKFDVTVNGDGIVVEVKHGWDGQDGRWQVIGRRCEWSWNTSDREVFHSLRRVMDSLNNHSR